MLSIIIPTLGRHQSLLRLLNSIETQALPEGGAEVLIVFNRNSVSFLLPNQLKNNISVRTLIAQEAGVNHARNTGVTAAQGNLLYFVDDDCSLPDNQQLERLAQLHYQNPQINIIGGGYRSTGKTNLWGRAYNTNISHWLTQGQTHGHLSDTFVGGNTSYKARVFEKNYCFTPGIAYGGSETPLNQQIINDCGPQYFSSELDLLHESDLSFSQFTRKAQKQGQGLAIQKNLLLSEERAAAPLKRTSDENHIYFALQIYSLFFMAGYRQQTQRRTFLFWPLLQELYLRGLKKLSGLIHSRPQATSPLNAGSQIGLRWPNTNHCLLNCSHCSQSCSQTAEPQAFPTNENRVPVFTCNTIFRSDAIDFIAKNKTDNSFLEVPLSALLQDQWQERLRQIHSLRVPFIVVIDRLPAQLTKYLDSWDHCVHEYKLVLNSALCTQPLSQILPHFVLEKYSVEYCDHTSPLIDSSMNQFIKSSKPPLANWQYTLGTHKQPAHHTPVTEPQTQAQIKQPLFESSLLNHYFRYLRSDLEEASVTLKYTDWKGNISYRTLAVLDRLYGYLVIAKYKTLAVFAYSWGFIMTVLYKILAVFAYSWGFIMTVLYKILAVFAYSWGFAVITYHAILAALGALWARAAGPLSYLGYRVMAVLGWLHYWTSPFFGFVASLFEPLPRNKHLSFFQRLQARAVMISKKFAWLALKVVGQR